MSNEPLYAANFTFYYMALLHHLLDTMCDSYTCRTNRMALLRAFIRLSYRASPILLFHLANSGDNGVASLLTAHLQSWL